MTPWILTDLKRTLEKRGHTVLLAGSGLQGIDDASLKPDLIITDLVMPLVDGLELVQKVRAAGLRMLIIMYGAGISDTSRSAVLRSGADVVVEKGAGFEALFAAVDGLLVATPH